MYGISRTLKTRRWRGGSDMDGASCVTGFECDSTRLAGYRRLDWTGDEEGRPNSAGDGAQPMRVSSSDDSSEGSDLGSGQDWGSDLGWSPSAERPMSDSLDLHPLLGSPCHQPALDSASVSRHVPTWVMRAQLDDSNANALPAPPTAAMPRLTAALSPLSPAIEKAEIERSEKPAEINGNVLICRDGARPKTLDKLKTSRHVTCGAASRSPKHRRSVAEADAERPRETRVHFSNDACVPRKQEKMMMNTSLKMGLESPRKPSRPTSLSVTSRQLAGRPPPGQEARQAQPAGGRPSAPVDVGTVAPPGGLTVGAGVVKRREKTDRSEEKVQHRKSCPVGPIKEERASSPDGYNGYDVYNLETSLPKIDWDAIENHLKSVREQERKRRNDREAIRRKLAMGHEADEAADGAAAVGSAARPSRKPSLQSRLQGGMNLQICFMNETASDEEDEDEFSSGLLARRCSAAAGQSESAQFQSLPVDLANWPKFSQPPPVARESAEPVRTADFVRHQAQLQSEARLALAQAKQMARMQMEIERQSRKSPISDVVRLAFQKIGVPFPDGRRRVSRHLLTEMNIAQLQVIVNDFHTRIEGLNEALVRYLMERDELHMEQDSKLVHIEDLTSYFGQKHQDAPPEPPPTSAADAKRKPRGSLRITRAK